MTEAVGDKTTPSMGAPREKIRDLLHWKKKNQSNHWYFPCRLRDTATAVSRISMKQQQILFNISLLQQRKAQIRPFSEQRRSCSGDASGPGRDSLQSAQHQAQQQSLEQRVPGGTRLPGSEGSADAKRRRAPCLVADGEALAAASRPAQPKHWPEGECWLQQLWRSVWKGEIKMGKHGRPR